jgi:FtsP/CotA-like multicopper oxidase with cupredoxin domain
MIARKGKMAALPALLLLLFAWTQAEAVVDGITGTTFNLTAMPTYISTADGASILVWGFGADGGWPQYPAPTLIVNQGDIITVNVTNYLPEPVSIVFPGQEGVTASGGTPGLLAQEAPTTGGTVTYTFTANHAGTYLYQSGTHPELQIEMGLAGAIVVRPSPVNRAYEHADTTFDHEYLFLLTEIDPRIHELVEYGLADQIDNTDYHSVLWLINGRAGPDTLADANIPWMPSQPYNALARTHPGETVLLRVIGAGRELHPFHVHGNNVTVIGRDGRMLSSAPGGGPDLGRSEYTIQTLPGATYDALFTWTGEKLGWDIYGHAAGDPLQPGEYALDHGKPFPVILPELQSLTFGGFYSGSPFLGILEGLPPGEGGLNLNGGLFFMWHSHTEKELVNNDIFPGGMMTMVIIEPPGVPIP